QMVPKLAAAAECLLAACRQRRPQMVIFLSCYLFDAFRHEALADEIRALFGSPLEKSRRLTRGRMRAEGVRYERALVLGLPLPSRNTTAAVADDLVEGLSTFFRANSLR
ncbi:hypothetical protein EVA_04979, partial [gut metagenome]